MTGLTLAFYRFFLSRFEVEPGDVSVTIREDGMALAFIEHNPRGHVPSVSATVEIKK